MAEEKKRVWAFTTQTNEEDLQKHLSEDFEFRSFTEFPEANDAFSSEVREGNAPHLVLVDGAFGPQHVNMVEHIKKLRQRAGAGEVKFLVRPPYFGHQSEKEARKASLPVIPAMSSGTTLKRQLREHLRLP